MEGSDKSNESHGKRRRRAFRRKLEGLISDGFIPDTKSKLQRAFNKSPSDPHSSTSSAESSDSGRIHENSDGGPSGGEGSSEGKNGGLVYGHVAMMGRRRAMEDAVTVAPPGWLAGKYSFFAVYDGHGGAEVAEKCREKMHNCLEKHIEKASKIPEEKDFDWEKVMEDCFWNMDVELDQTEKSGDEAAAVEEERMMGSTAMVVLVGKEEVVVANCGDSRAVLCQRGVAVPLSRDHKPDREDEKERIEAAGGKILNWNGWRVQGVLATSRSLGDRYLKPYVSCKPEVTVVRRSESDEFLIIATDGLFDVVSNETACEVVKKCLSGQIRRGSSEETSASEAAATLAELAIAKGSRDNISVIVVQLK
ncbi:probable protein phosphatase 2C 8 isoform X2 [Sesamum indicum]|uniref:protein-serine/threonine phosphatase n=1 Tax=Sesamum indicum TaxID=4182 RepID=A0A6I9UQQ1_SESIN|nr:probable protein phosphatase 2C 8 isoform X2 [Sesamum indicum]